jgi:hypothetical protein
VFEEMYLGLNVYRTLYEMILCTCVQNLWMVVVLHLQVCSRSCQLISLYRVVCAVPAHSADQHHRYHDAR